MAHMTYSFPATWLSMGRLWQPGPSVRATGGAPNQRFHYLMDAYDAAIEIDERYRNGIAVRFETLGTLRVNGFPFLS